MDNIQFVTIEMADGSVAVMQFLTEYRASVEGEDLLVKREATDEAIEKEIQRSGFSNRKGWRRIERAAIPTDRTFRDAWTASGKGVAVDMGKAREIAKMRDRIALAEGAFLALKTDPRIDAAKSVDELSQVLGHRR